MTDAEALCTRLANAEARVAECALMVEDLCLTAARLRKSVKVGWWMQDVN